MKGTGVGQRPQRVKWIIINFHDQLCFICSKFVNLQEEVKKKKEKKRSHAKTNLIHMDERTGETNLEGLTFVYLQTPELEACCSCWCGLLRMKRRYLTTAVRKSRAYCFALVQQARDGERGSSMKEEKKTASPLILIM